MRFHVLAAAFLLLGLSGAGAQTIIPGGGGSGAACTFANPTATIGASAVNGVAPTCMRSDGAPALPATLPALNGSLLTNLNGSAIASGTVSTANGGLGANNSAASGVPVFAAGTATVTATTGTGSVVLAASPTFSGTIGGTGVVPNTALANNSMTIGGASTALGGTVTATTILDSIASTRGGVLYRGASGWAVLSPGTSGNFLKTNGAGADPTWAAAGGGSSTYTLAVSGAVSGTPSAVGLGLDLQAATFTDNATAGSGTAALFAAHSIEAPTLAASNTSVTTTHAATLYVANAPTTGTNETISAKSAVYIAAGNMNFGSNASSLNLYNVGSPGVTNREWLSFNWATNVATISTNQNGTGAIRQLTIHSNSALQLQSDNSNNIAFLYGGTQVMTMNNGNLFGGSCGPYIQFTVGGSLTQPSFTPCWSGSLNSGLGGSGTSVSLISNGANIMSVTTTGPVVTTIPADTASTDATLCRDTTSGAMKTGTGTLGVCLGTSSRRFKTDIRPMPEGLDEILKLQPVNFHYRRGVGHDQELAKKQYGFIAEDANASLPGLVGRDTTGKIATFDYVGLIPVLVNAVKAQQIQIVALRRELAKQRRRAP